MSYTGDAAEQVVRMSLETGEVAVKLAGAGAKEIAMMLYVILRDQKKTRGRTRLSNMLNSGKELKVFAVKDSELQKFCHEARKYGVLYCVLKDRDATDGITDIMVRAEDAGKVSRIFERFELSAVDLASVRTEIGRNREERGGADAPAAEERESTPQSGSGKKDTDAPEVEGTPVHTAPKEAERDTDDFLNALFGPDAKEDHAEENPTRAGTANRGQSGPTSERRPPTAEAVSDAERVRSRPSVKKALDEIRTGRQRKAAESTERQQPVHYIPQNKNKRKARER